MIRPRQYVLLLAFTLLPHITEIVTWVWVTSFFIVGWMLLADYRPQYKPKKLVVNFLTLLFPALIYFEFNTLAGPDAATSLLLLMITLKLFEVYSYRDAVVILALNLLLSMYHLVFVQDLVTTTYMIIVMAWVFYLMFKLNRPASAPTSQKLQLKGLLGPETVLSIPLLLALFFFFPRISTPIGRFIEKKGDVVGFSEDLRPGDMADLANSNEVAFRVEFKKGRQLEKDELYFRGQTLEVTDGVNWLKSPNREQILRARYNEELPGQHYRITFEPRFKKLVFAIDQTYAFKIQGAGSGIEYFDNNIIQTEKPNQIKFQLTGVRSDARYKFEDNSINQLMLPNKFYDNNPRLSKLSKDIQSRASDIPTRISEIRSFFKSSNLTYSLSTPDYASVDALLFDQKIGFCEHFASAAAILARTMGIKARVVIGFQGGEMNEYGNYFVVRDRHAHAWMEYVNANNEWVRLDPTAEVSNYRIAQGLTLGDLQERENTNATLLALARNIWDMLDNVNNQFALMLLDMNQNSQLDWLKKLGFQNPDRRTIWKVFAGVLIFILSLILLVLWLRRPKVNATQRLRLALISKLNSLEIGYTEDLGPLETLDLLNSKKPEEQDIQLAVRDYMNLRYSSVPNKSAEEIYQRLNL